MPKPVALPKDMPASASPVWTFICNQLQDPDHVEVAKRQLYYVFVGGVYTPTGSSLVESTVAEMICTMLPPITDLTQARKDRLERLLTTARRLTPAQS